VATAWDTTYRPARRMALELVVGTEGRLLQVGRKMLCADLIPGGPTTQRLKSEKGATPHLPLLPPQRLHHPLIIIHRRILNHNLAFALAVANPHSQSQNPLQLHLR
jgi:hypothetical protein